MKKIIIGSVFANDSPQQQKWLDLQLNFLKATTEDFDHVVVVSEGLTNDYFQKKTKVLVPFDKSPKSSFAHLAGLNILLSHFKDCEEKYENFLFIDSDAFPIKKSWINFLLNKMKKKDFFDDPKTGNIIPLKHKSKYYEIASILRSENLETRLHASVLFARKDALSKLNFDIGIVGNDLLGNSERDVFIPVYQKELRDFAFPLIRTNKKNIHPVACGVYFDMFYHHCCGSGRKFSLRSNDYFSGFIKNRESFLPATEKLMKNPFGFVNELAGWSPLNYVN
jgi:hypothetical protein